MTKNRKWIIPVITILGLAVVIIAVITGMNYSKHQVYTENVALGNKYYASGDYESAILSYEKALKANSTDSDSYIGLIRTYISKNNFDMAKNVYEKAMRKCMNFNLPSDLLKQLIEYGFTPESINGEKVNLNTNLLSMIGGNTYNDYRVRSGIQSAIKKSDNSILVRVCDVSADFNFKNTNIQERAVDLVNKTVNAGAVPYSVVLDSPVVLFGTNNVSYEQLKSLPVSDFKYSDNKVSFRYSNCLVTITTDKNGDVKADSVCTLVPNAAISTEKQTDATISGTVVDATTGKTVSTVTMKFHSGGKTGQVIETQKTDAYGKYECKLESGNYTVEMSLNGYITEFTELYVGTYQSEVSQNFTISPELASGDIRIVLEWNDYPQDLDSHLCSQKSGYDVCYLSPEADFAELDVDDTDGYGPETITIHDFEGTYKYSVDDFNDTGALMSSGATVKVYVPGKDVQIISISSATVQSNNPQAIWSVLTIEDGSITIDNKVVC